MSDARTDPLDCLVVCAGPAGLTAAIYLARYRLSVEIIDAGKSRAALIPARTIMPAILAAFSVATRRSKRHAGDLCCDGREPGWRALV